MLSIVPASPAHIGPVATRMRAIDRLEAAVFGYSPKAALRHALNGAAMAWTAKVDGRPEAMFGVAAISSIEGIGSPWMLGTDEIARHARAMVTQAREYVDAMQRDFPRLENRVHVDNRKAVAWLKRLDFEFGSISVIAGETFVSFYRG